MARYDDDEFGVGREEDRAHPTLAGMYGFISAMVSLGLVGVVVVLWLLLNEENQLGVDDRTRWMFYWFMFLDVLSFIGSLVAIILGIRSMTPSNPLYRGFGIAALILGIIELVATSFFGLGLFCCTMLFEIHRAGG